MKTVFFKYNGIRKAATAAALICLAVMAVSCHSVKEFQSVRDSVAIHDTTIITSHDTTKVTEVRYDSVDRYVEKLVYIDSNGVWHEREVERLTRYIYKQDEQYRVRENEYKSRISELEKSIAEKSVKKVVTVEGKPNIFQRLVPWLGGALILLLAGWVVFMYVKRAIKK